MKSIIEKLDMAIFYFFAICLPNVAFADDPFATATEKTDEAVQYLSGGFAVAICTLVIVVAAIAMLMNKLRMEWGLRIIGGAVIIASAAGIADFLLT
jgi:type IV secretory pathway VirB2 component (pilin)